MSGSQFLMMVFQQFVSRVLIVLMLSGVPSSAWQVAPAPKSAAAEEPRPQEPTIRMAPGEIKVNILLGKTGIHLLSVHKSTPIAVEVVDSNGMPIEGAEVTLTAPLQGAGGTFGNEKSVFTARTGYQGQVGTEFTARDTLGSFSIQIKAKAGTKTAEASAVHQTVGRLEDSSGRVKKPIYRNWKTMTFVAIGVTAVVAVVLATRGSTSTATPTVIPTPGGVGIGGPR